MTSTAVIQSSPGDRLPIIARAQETVRNWAENKNYAYFHENDRIFARLPDWVVPKVTPRMQMAADLARLLWIAELLDDGWQRVIWLDADVLIFRPDNLSFDDDMDFAFGREYWAVPDGREVKIYRNVHNAVLVFTPAGRITLDFYLEAAERLLRAAEMSVPPQFIGPKLLTALHNVVQFPLSDAVAMLSPIVMKDLADNGGVAWQAVKDRHGPSLAAANLSASMFGKTADGVTLSPALVDRAVACLLGNA